MWAEKEFTKIKEFIKNIRFSRRPEIRLGGSLARPQRSAAGTSLLPLLGVDSWMVLGLGWCVTLATLPSGNSVYLLSFLPEQTPGGTCFSATRASDSNPGQVCVIVGVCVTAQCPSCKGGGEFSKCRKCVWLHWEAQKKWASAELPANSSINLLAVGWSSLGSVFSDECLDPSHY